MNALPTERTTTRLETITQQTIDQFSGEIRQVTHIVLPNGGTVLCPTKEIANLIVYALYRLDRYRELLRAAAVFLPEGSLLRNEIKESLR